MSKLIKQRAQCCKFIMNDGDIVHYVRIGGRWYYNGRKSLELNKVQATAEGFWLDNALYTLSRSSSYTFKEMVNAAIAKNKMQKPKLVNYIREWLPTGDCA